MPTPLVAILMGVSGVGKTTVGEAVADELGWAFFDADDFHSAANKAKMHRGEGLTDADRAPWLRALHDLVERRLEAAAPAVIACSALRASYRDELDGHDPRVRIVWLDAPRAVIAERLAHREGHFAGGPLLQSQFATLEPPSEDDALHVRADAPVARVVDRVVRALETSA